jgi:hypothetical protein
MEMAQQLGMDGDFAGDERMSGWKSSPNQQLSLGL